MDAPEWPVNYTTRQSQYRNAARWRRQYMSMTGDQQPSPGMLAWYGDMIGRKESGTYQLAAASCAAEAALHASPDLTLEHRQELLETAAGHWVDAFDHESLAPNDIAERVAWELSQLETYEAVAAHMHGLPPDPAMQGRQEAAFRDYFGYILERWPHENLDGHTIEVLCSYFLHRSNRLRPHEAPLYSLPAPVRADHHPRGDRRVDVLLFATGQNLRYGIQVKGGRMTDPYDAVDEQHRIFFRHARKLLCLPYSERAVVRTLSAITDGDPAHYPDLDTIAADHRARMLRRIVLPRYMGAVIVDRARAGRQPETGGRTEDDAYQTADRSTCLD